MNTNVSKVQISRKCTVLLKTHFTCLDFSFKKTMILFIFLRDHINKTALICQNNKKVSFWLSAIYTCQSHIYQFCNTNIALNNKGTRVAHFFQPCTQKNCIYASEHMKFVCTVNIYTSNTVIPSIFGFLFTLL